MMWEDVGSQLVSCYKIEIVHIHLLYTKYKLNALQFLTVKFIMYVDHCGQVHVELETTHSSNSTF